VLRSITGSRSSLVATALVVFVAISLVLSPGRGLLSIYVAATFLVILPAGATLLLAIQELTAARWLLSLRCYLYWVSGKQAVTSTLFLATLLAVLTLFPWVEDPSSLSPFQRIWLQPLFFLGRTCLYLVIWTLFSRILRTRIQQRRIPEGSRPSALTERGASGSTEPRTSVSGLFATGVDVTRGLVPYGNLGSPEGLRSSALPEGGANGSTELRASGSGQEERAKDKGQIGHRESKIANRIAAGFLPVFAVTFWLAMVDWVLSFSPHWHTTLFAFYRFSVLLVAVTAVLVLVSCSGPGRLGKETHPIGGPLRDLARFLLFACCLWGYLWFCLYMLIWYAGIPAETALVTLQLGESWSAVFVVIPIICWLLPFLALLSNRFREDRGLLTLLGGLVLLGTWLELYLSVFPSRESFNLLQLPLDLAPTILMVLYLTGDLRTSKRPGALLEP
jgi:hypothetical protein